MPMHPAAHIQPAIKLATTTYLSARVRENSTSNINQTKKGQSVFLSLMSLMSLIKVENHSDPFLF